MVYPDLSQSHSLQKKNLPIAPVADRFLAFFFDFLIFTPVFSFILAQVFRDLTFIYFSSPRSVEFLALLTVAILFLAILTILFQTLFLVAFGATPGKFFFKITVISLSNSQKRLSFSQAFLRSALWVGEFFLFALPWLEVLSETHRRPLHDRAAGTMVVTKKQQGDPGPHYLESHFVRQILIVCSMLVMMVSIFGVGHFYRQATHGDFKKTQLEADEYLCSSVTQSMGPNENRIDKALALFLAGEISESCLVSEADFVLWAPSEPEKAWAYLAKGILHKKTDLSQFEAYLQKSCDQDVDGPACQIAEFQANPNGKQIPEGSQTALILQINRDWELGRYQAAEKQFIRLAQQRGFEIFSQQGLIKSLWSQNKVEKSMGAYLNVFHQMGKSSKVELAAWICNEELDRHCNQEAIESCEDLKAVLRSSDTPVQDSYAALAVVRENECRQTTDFDPIQLKNIFVERKDVLMFVTAISRGSSLSQEQRLSLLRDMGFRKEPVRPQFLRLMAIKKWVEQEKSEEQLKIAVQFLREKKVRDLSWIKIYQSTLKSLLQIKSENLAKEIASLPSRDIIQKFHLEESQIRAHYLAKSFEKAQSEIQWMRNSRRDGDSSLRAPASSERLTLNEIEKEVSKEIAKHPKKRLTNGLDVETAQRTDK